jgi:hypothetical protein
LGKVRVLTFGIALWVAQRNLGDRALGGAQKSGNSSDKFLDKKGIIYFYTIVKVSILPKGLSASIHKN